MRKKTRPTAAAGLLLLLLLLLSADYPYIKNTQALLLDESKMPLKETAVQSARQIQYQKDADLAILRLLASDGLPTRIGRFMRQFGCDIVQGFYFARPLPQEAFMALLQ